MGGLIGALFINQSHSCCCQAYCDIVSEAEATPVLVKNPIIDQIMLEQNLKTQLKDRSAAC